MTPVRNEAWVLNLFLKATSLWADYIIIADQHSSDGSREIALNYPKVVLIENNNPNYNEADRQRLLIEKAREIKGDKIIFAFDADEILSANYMNSNDWELILKSKPGDIFFMQWAQVCANQTEYWVPEDYFPWVIHDREDISHESYVRNIHSMRIPYSDELPKYYVKDFKVLHFQHVFPQRNLAKQRFYMFVDYDLNNRSIVSLSRTYLLKRNKMKLSPLNLDMLYKYEKSGFETFDQIDFINHEFWFNYYIFEGISTIGTYKYRKIDIWHADFLEKYNLKDPRNIFWKILHQYFFYTQNYSNSIVIKTIDKLLKLFGF